MNRDEAIAAIKGIQSGDGVDRDVALHLRGEFAVAHWDDDLFVYGLEYGVMIGLMLAFGIDEEELLPSRLWRSDEDTARIENAARTVKEYV